MAYQTNQRDAIRAAFDAAERPLSAREAHDAARTASRRVGLATVYRNLRALVDEGYLVEVDLPGTATHYERADLAHHHHFYCRTCQRVYDLAPGCAGSLRRLTPRGFEVESHELILYGYCDRCRAPARRRR